MTGFADNDRKWFHRSNSDIMKFCCSVFFHFQTKQCLIHNDVSPEQMRMPMARPSAPAGMTIINHVHYVIMSAIVPQITGVSIVCSTLCWGAYQRKHQSAASLTFVSTGGFPGASQRVSDAENVSIWWHHLIITSWVVTFMKSLTVQPIEQRVSNQVTTDIAPIPSYHITQL